MPHKQTQLRTHQTEKRSLVVKFRSSTWDKEKRTVEFTLATSAPADFGAYNEVLGLDDGELRTKRLDDGIVPVLDSHPQAQWKVQTIDDQFGVVISWRKESDEVIGTCKFSTDDRSERAFKKVGEEIVKTGSIGYFVYRHRDISGPEDKKKTFRAIDWEIVEFSLVSIPRDPDAQARNVTAETIQTVIEEKIISTSQERNLNMPPEQNPNPENRGLSAAETEKVRQEATAETQSRILDIQTACRNAELDEEFASKLIREGHSMADASKLILKEWKERKEKAATTTNTPAIDIDHKAEAGKRDARIDAMATAIEHRIDSSVKVEGLARSFAGMSLSEMQRESLRLQGVDVRNLDREMVMRQAFQGTSDFPMATQQAISKKVKKGYDYASTNFKPLISETSRSDFKPAASVSLSDAPNLEKMNEHGEFKTGTFGEGKEIYAIETFGKRIALTRQAIINDDLGLFDKVPYSMGVAGARGLHKLIWSIISANKKMSDDVTLFHASHLNLIANKADLAAAVKALVAALRVQKSPKGELMNYNPGYLIVGSDLEIEARQLVTATTATKAEDVNVFANTLQGAIIEASLPAKSVYLTGRREECDMIEVAWLNGNRGVNVRQRDNPNILGVEWDVFMDVGAAALDYRGLYKGGLT